MPAPLWQPRKKQNYHYETPNAAKQFQFTKHGDRIMPNVLIDAIVGLREEDALKILRNRLDAGAGPMDLLADTREAMEVIGKRFEDGDCFMPELILAGEILYQISLAIQSRVKVDTSGLKIGKVIIGSVKGDFHDTPKNIVAFMLEANGFEVTDLGADVSPEEFVRAARDTRTGVVALSGFLSQSHDPMKATVTALKNAGLEVKVMIGGGQVDENVRAFTGADAFGKDALDAVRLARQWYEK
jgi:5-methyltetrahydrofolate--homocysteine methyltransferase